MPPDAELVAADAERRGSVEVRVARQPELDTRFHPGRRRRIVAAKIGDIELAETTMILALAAPITLVAPEIGQHVAIAPAHGAQTLPVVETLILAANEDQAIDRRRAAQHAAARPDDGAAARDLARFGGEQAGEPLVVDGSVIANRKLEPEVAVGSSRLQQQDAAGRIGGQPVRDHATGRTRADDNVIITLDGHANSRTQR
jgi:hypothetical protein